MICAVDGRRSVPNWFSSASLAENMKIRIMAVDDEPAVLDLLKPMVETHGYEVLAIGDSREALKRLEDEKVDGLFVDVNMPHLDGFELTRLVRTLKLNGQVPIVMLTGSDDGETMRKGFNMGISFFLGKPFTRERVHKLLGAIKGSMEREQLRYVRVPLLATVGCSWEYHSAGQFKSDAQNISEGGMRLRPLEGLVVGQAVSLAFTLPNISRKFSVNAQVARKFPDGGIGMKFVALPPQDKSSLQQYISACLKD
jgi:CheY-like chemotaxis protein